MFVAAWRYTAALSLALCGGLLAQPALARAHHHSASSRTAHYYAHRHSALVVAAATPDTWQTLPQNYWQHGWRGHLAQQQSWQQNNWQKQNTWQQNGWQQNGWQPTAWRQENWQQQSRRQRRAARRQEAAYFGNGPGYAPAYYDQAPQYSWSSSGGGFGTQSELSGMIAQAASSAGVPVSLAERVVRRESGGNPRAVHAGNYGLMQIRLGTARAMGYGGSASGLLDPSVNMTYAMRYLAGAYRAAGGNESRAVALYARGYHATPARVQTYTF
jgi:soluble lytic murein transglycosylase-like protein